MIAAILLTLAQPAAAAPVPPPAPRTLAQDRLDVCMDQARTDPTTAIAEASAWERETGGVDRSEAQQCLGVAYTVLLRWEAAERAYVTRTQRMSNLYGAIGTRWPHKLLDLRTKILPLLGRTDFVQRNLRCAVDHVPAL